MEEMYSNLTLAQIFNLAPQHSNFLTQFEVFAPNGSIISSDETIVNLNETFRLLRYYMQQFVCYYITYKTEMKYDFESVAQENEASVLGLWLDPKKLSRVDYFQVIIHDRGLPFTSRYYATYTPGPSRAGVGQGQGVSYQFSYAITNYIRLPPPYKTNCGLVNGHYNVVCRKQCFVNAVVKHMGKMPTNWPLPESNLDHFDYNMNLIHFSYEMNDTLIDLYHSLRRQCDAQCQRSACRYQVSTTSLLSTNVNEFFKMWILMPVYPATEINYLPAFPLMDFIIYVTSCLGTWLGFSVLDLNPLKFITKRNRGQQNNNTRLARLERRYANVVQHCEHLTQQLRVCRNQVRHLHKKVHYWS